MATFEVIDETETDPMTLAQLEYEYQLTAGEATQVANLPVGQEMKFEDGFTIRRVS